MPASLHGLGEGLNFRKFFRKFASPAIFDFRKFPRKFASLVSIFQPKDALKAPRRAVKAYLRLRRRFVLDLGYLKRSISSKIVFFTNKHGHDSQVHSQEMRS